jgi:hypothetical protein
VNLSTIDEYSPDGRIERSVKLPGDGFHTLAVDPRGHFFVGTQDSVQELSDGGATLHTWNQHKYGPGNFQQVQQLAADSHGNMYVADRETGLQGLVAGKP